jgi:deoxyribonuclease-4
MRFGAHVPTRGRPAYAVDYAEAIGADAFQIFVGNPRAWAPPPLSQEAALEFRERRADSGVGAVFVHSSYLVNIASPDPAFLRRSVDLASAELEAAAVLGADGLVVHAGAGGPGERDGVLERAATSVAAIAGRSDSPMVLLELTAGGSGTVASTVPQAADLLEAVDDTRVGVCLDTCHLFAAGYALDDPAQAAGPLDELRSHGLDRRLGLIHGNDSRDPRGSRRDRHAPVGQGIIGEGGFAAFLADPAVRPCAVLAEVSGGPDEHARNVAALRRLAGV